jgi:hypothetical protein
VQRQPAFEKVALVRQLVLAVQPSFWHWERVSIWRGSLPFSFQCERTRGDAAKIACVAFPNLVGNTL